MGAKMKRSSWAYFGGFLIVAGASAVAAHFLSLESSLAMIIVGMFFLGFGLRRADSNKKFSLPAWLPILVISLLLFAFYYLTSGRRGVQ
jgi:hypothetical protein